MKPFILAIIFVVPLLYTRYKKGKWHASISEIYYEEDIRIIWKFTLIGTALVLATYHHVLLNWAAVSILGVGIFPEINKPKIKKIHDAFAVSFFFMIGWYVHPIMLLLMGIALAQGRKFMSLYWLEWLGMFFIVAGLTIKELGWI